MTESQSVRRALSRLREEISPTRDDKARLRGRILAPALLLAPEGADPAATMPPPMTPAVPGSPETSPACGGAAAAVQAAQPAARAAPLTPWAALKATGTIGAATGLALLGAGGGVGFWLGHEAANPSDRSSSALEAPAGRAEAPLVRELAGAESVPLASTTEPVLGAAAELASASANEARPGADAHRTEVAPGAPAGRRRAQPHRINDELALLRRVERALRNGEPALARALLDELDERFPDSRLGEERLAARRIADCRSAEPGATQSARAFVRDHAASVYRRRIALACGLDGESREKNAETAPMTNPE